MKALKDLQPGDKIIRSFYSGYPTGHIGKTKIPNLDVELTVGLVTDDLIWACLPSDMEQPDYIHLTPKDFDDLKKWEHGWTFNRETGVEEDSLMKWGAEYGRSGSWIKTDSPMPPNILDVFEVLLTKINKL